MIRYRKLYYKFCIAVLIDFTTLILPVEILCHSNHKFRAMLIIIPCQENKALTISFCQGTPKKNLSVLPVSDDTGML